MNKSKDKSELENVSNAKWEYGAQMSSNMHHHSNNQVTKQNTGGTYRSKESQFKIMDSNSPLTNEIKSDETDKGAGIMESLAAVQQRNFQTPMLQQLAQQKESNISSSKTKQSQKSTPANMKINVSPQRQPKHHIVSQKTAKSSEPVLKLSVTCLESEVRKIEQNNTVKDETEINHAQTEKFVTAKEHRNVQIQVHHEDQHSPTPLFNPDRCASRRYSSRSSRAQSARSLNRPDPSPKLRKINTMASPAVHNGLARDKSPSSSIKDEDMVQDLCEEDMEKLKKIMRILTEKMDENNALQALDKIMETPDNEDDQDLDLVEGIFYIEQQTLTDKCLGKTSKQQEKILIYDVKSLYLFHFETSFRRKLVAFTVSQAFENFVIFVIFLNSVTLAIRDYNDRDNESEYNLRLEHFGHAFTVVFTIEFLLKIISMGFIIHKNSYLRDAWNWLDFLVVMIGLSELVPIDAIKQLSWTGFRTLRVLRPLRSINAFPSLRRFVQALLRSLPSLGNAVVFMFFIFLLFGILGIQQFGGATHRRCRFTEEPVDGLWPYNEDIDSLCSLNSTSGNSKCPIEFFCKEPLDGSLDLNIDNPEFQGLIDYGLSNFDNLGNAMLTIFTMITLEGWTKIMYNLMDSSNPYAAIAFCVSLVIVGAFFLLNVILAVLADALDKVDENQQRMTEEQNKATIRSIQRAEQQQQRSLTRSISRMESIEITEPISPNKTAKLTSSLSLNNAQNSGDDSSNSSNEEIKTIEGQTPIGLSINIEDQNPQPAAQSQTARKVSQPLLDKATAALTLRNESLILAEENMFHTRSVSIATGQEEFTQAGNQLVPTLTLGDRYLRNQQNQSKLTGDDTTPGPTYRESARTQQTLLGDMHRDFCDNELQIKQPSNQVKIMPVIQEQLSIPLVSKKSLKKVMKSSQDVLNSSNQQSFTDSKVSASIQDSEPTPYDPDVRRHNSLLDQKKLMMQQIQQSRRKSTIVGGEVLSAALQKKLNHSLSMGEQQKFKRNRIIRQNTAEDNNIPIHAQQNRCFGCFFVICTHYTFTLCITILIIINTIVLAIDKYPEDEDTMEIAEQLNSFFTYCFIFEMIVKIVGLGVKEYVKDQFNLFDAVIVIISIIEMALTQINSEFQSGAFTAFRGVRLLRVFKLARSWTSFRDLLSQIVVSLKEVFTFFLLLVIGMFIFTLLGMELFGFKIYYDEDGQIDVDGKFPPRPNFNSVYNGFVTIFVVFIGEMWNEVMYDHYRGEKVASLIFFPLLYVTLNLILLSLFLVILLKNFYTVHDEKEGADSENKTLFGIKKRLQIKYDRCYRRCVKKRIRPGSPVSPTSSTSNSVVFQDLEPTTRGSSLFKRTKTGHQFLQNKVAAMQLKNEARPEMDREQTMSSGLNLVRKQNSLDKEVSLDGSDSRFKNNQGFPGRFTPSDEMEFENEQQPPKFGRFLTIVESEDIGRTNDQQDQANGLPGLQTQDTIAVKRRRKVVRKRKLREAKQKQLDDTKVQMSIAILKDQEKSKEARQKRIEMRGNSLYMFSPQNKLRILCHKIVSFKHYDNIVIGFIVISTILLTLDNPLNDPKGQLFIVLTKTDYVMTALFTGECILNIILFGLILNGSNSYLRNSWNMMDFFIVVFALASIMVEDYEIGFLKVFRMLRVLRPLRVLKRNLGLKIQVVSLLKSIPGIMNLMLILILVLMLFGIQGVTFFKGKFYFCSTDNIPRDISRQITTEWECYDCGGEWVRYEANFDNVLNAMLTMFNMMTAEGWVDILWRGVDATNIHQVPIRDYNPRMTVFFVLFLIIGSLFILNLFVGIVIGTFADEKEKASKNNLLTDLQHEYCEVLIKGYNSVPIKEYTKSDNRITNWSRSVAQSKVFETFIFICICLNTVCLALTWYGQSENTKNVLEIINYFFTGIYTLEFLIKLIAFKKDYFYNGWNIFDFLIVVSAWVGIIATQVFNLDIGPISTVVRSFRISRILKIIKRLKELHKIYLTFLVAAPELVNVGLLLLLFLYLYSVLGVYLFSEVKLQKYLDRNANFQHFGNAILTLFRMSTGENWNYIMYDAGRSRGIFFDCMERGQTYEERQEYGIQGCGNPGVAIFFFTSFMLLVSFIFLNLFIAIILEAFAKSQLEQSIRINEDTIEAFQNAWKKFDGDATGMIKIEDLMGLVVELTAKEFEIKKKQNMDENSDLLFNFQKNRIISLYSRWVRGIDIESEELVELCRNSRLQRYIKKKMNQAVTQMKLPVYDSFQHYNYHDTLDALINRSFSDEHKKNYEERQQRIEEHTALGKSDELRPIDKIKRETDEWWALPLIQEEQILEADDPEFQGVINRMENKDSNIIKLKHVRDLRIKVSKHTRKKLTRFYESREIVDSSLVCGALVIKRWLDERKARRSERKAMDENKYYTANRRKEPPTSPKTDSILHTEVQSPMSVNNNLASLMLKGRNTNLTSHAHHGEQETHIYEHSEMTLGATDRQFTLTSAKVQEVTMKSTMDNKSPRDLEKILQHADEHKDQKTGETKHNIIQEEIEDSVMSVYQLTLPKGMTKLHSGKIIYKNNNMNSLTPIISKGSPSVGDFSSKQDPQSKEDPQSKRSTIKDGFTKLANKAALGEEEDYPDVDIGVLLSRKGNKAAPQNSPDFQSKVKVPSSNMKTITLIKQPTDMVQPFSPVRRGKFVKQHKLTADIKKTEPTHKVPPQAATKQPFNSNSIEGQDKIISDGGGGSPRSFAANKVSEYTNVRDIWNLPKHNAVLNLDSRGSDANSGTFTDNLVPITKQPSLKQEKLSNISPLQMAGSRQTQPISYQISPANRPIEKQQLNQQSSSISPPSSRLNTHKITGKVQPQAQNSHRRMQSNPLDLKRKGSRLYGDKSEQKTLIQLKKQLEKHLDQQDDFKLDDRKKLTMAQYQEMADNAFAKASSELYSVKKTPEKKARRSEHGSKSGSRAGTRQKSRDLATLQLRSIYYK